ncbi:hypothetical protein Tco_0057887 [Tanacetum coccineum]
MANLKFADTHNMVAFLSKPKESDGFEQIVDFLNAHPIKYALTVNPTIYISCIEQFWSTVKAKTINGEVQLPCHRVDVKSSKTTAWNEFSNEAVHKELGDSLVRAATTFYSTYTTASSLEAEQDSGNTLRSDEDRLKLEELMALCTNLQNRVLDLEKTKTTQQNENASLKKEGMFDMDALNGEEVFVAGQNENVVEEVVDAAQVSTAATTVTITTEEITLAQALEALKTSKPKVKGIVFQEPGKSTTTTTTTISSQQSQDKGKGILIKPMEPMKKKDLIRLDEEVALKLQAEFDEEERLAREKAKKEQEANIALIETWDDIQAKIDVDHQLAERLQAQEQEELSVEEKATLFQTKLREKKKKAFFQLKSKRVKETNHPTKAHKKHNMYLPKKHGRIQAHMI